MTPLPPPPTSRILTLLVATILAGCKSPPQSEGLTTPDSIQITSEPKVTRHDERRPPYSFRDVVRPAKDAVVNLYTTTRTKRPSPSPGVVPGVVLPPTLEQRRSQSLGSGFIFDADSGYVLTNWHVVEGADSIIARFSNSQSVYATLVGYDTKADLAVLRIPTDHPLTPLKIAEKNELEAGDWVVAIGNPFGFANTVTVGVVSATGRQPLNIGDANTTDKPVYEDFIQTDASINPGNSGGPLLDIDGQVVGINTATYQHGSGLGFAIPSQIIRAHLPRLLEGGKIKHGWLGMNIDNLPELAGRELGVKGGVLVTKVAKGGPADQAGVKPGDIVVSFAQKPTLSPQVLASMVVSRRPGESGEFEIWRGDRKMKVKVTLGELKDVGVGKGKEVADE